MSILSIALIAGTAFGQSNTRKEATAKKTQLITDDNTPAVVAGPRGTVLWSDDFSDPGTWTIVNDNSGVPLEWEIGVGLESTGGFPTPAILSTTAANGYAMVDSDGANNTTGTYESNTLTTALPIDLSLDPNVIIQFENQYRRFNDEMTYLVISTDGVTWPALDPATDISAMPNVFRIFDWMNDPNDPSSNQGVSVGNPYTMRINISDVAGGQPQVWVRFHWTGIWGYTWYVDDVEIQTQDEYDLAVLNGYVSHTGTGDEYGRIPADQLNGTMDMGCMVINQGVNDHNNVVATGDNGTFSITGNTAVIAYPDTFSLDENTTHPTLSSGQYTTTFSYASDEQAADSSSSNDEWLRTFEVTDYVYSLDGIGNHPPGYENLTSIGTGTFTDETDGITLYTLYHVENAMTIYGLEVGLSAASVAGAIIAPSLHDTIDVLNDDVFNPIGAGDDYTITQADITNGSVLIPFMNAGSNVSFTLPPGSYYAAVSLYSDGGANDVSVLDDFTVPQPFWSSGINLIGDGTSYTNGTALAIRMVSDPLLGVQEVHELAGINVYPNPTNGILNITAGESGKYQVEVLNILGEVIATDNFTNNLTMDLSAFAAGMYNVRISTADAVAIRAIAVN